MKRIICLALLCLIIIFVFIGCEETPIGNFTPTDEEFTSARFQEIGREKISPRGGTHIDDIIYYVDKYTDIVYIYFIDWNANATVGGITVLYNENGMPMKLDEFMH